MVRRFLCFIKDVLLYADFQVIRPLFFPPERESYR